MTTHQPSGPLAPVDPQPVLGMHGEPCASCGAPLAADQRYCLDCGARRADARLPFRDILAAAPAAPAAAVHGPAGSAAAPPAHSEGNRSGTLAALAGLGVVLVALAAGVLIGQAGGGDSKQSTTPQVINLGGTAATPGAATTGSGASDTNGSSSKGASSSKSKSGSSGSSSSSSGSKASNPSIKNLEKLSPQQYQKQSQKLPKVVGTGGKPPPKDNKPAAGGGDFQSIG